jgi:metallophosphoesterase superfamily enzyme
VKRVLLIILLLPTIAFAASRRRTIVVSDMHLGVGRCATDIWHPYEDFRWDEDFQKFLLALRKKAIPTDLVLNGDTFELWQSIPKGAETRTKEITQDCMYGDENLSCTEQEAITRMSRVIQEHAATLASLRAFANDGENRVYIVPGNHDAALLYDGVEDILLRAVAAKPQRVTVARQGHWVSADGLIVAAHGHQMDETNAYKTWPNVFRTVGNTQHLERPWGEQFVQVYYNKIESDYPIIDNIAGEADSLRYGMAAEGKLRAIGHAARFVKFFLFSVSGRQLGDVLDTPEIEKTTSSTDWNISAIRREGPIFFAHAVPRDDIARPAIEAAVANGEFTDALPTLSDGDINAICDERAALAGAGVNIERCQTATLNAVVRRLTTDTNKRILDYLREIYQRLPADPEPPAFELAVFSHTHAAKDTFTAAVRNDDWEPSVLNTGAWQRLINGKQLKALLTARKIASRDALKKLSHNDLPRLYPYVAIEPYSDAPAGKLHHWEGVALPSRPAKGCP